MHKHNGELGMTKVPVTFASALITLKYRIMVLKIENKQITLKNENN
jgi:hypothetical protein